jgi:hypothetical protein
MKLWFADIELQAESSLLPWTRLGLVRFQRDSINGCHTSAVVLTSFAQLLPNRVLTITRNPHRPNVQIALAGIGERDAEVPRSQETLKTSALVRLRKRVRAAEAGAATFYHDGQFWADQPIQRLAWRGNDQGAGAYIGNLWLEDSFNDYLLCVEERIHDASVIPDATNSRLIFADAIRL